MPQRTDVFDLPRLGLTSGEGRRLELHVHVDPFSYGGQSYVVEPRLVPARLDVSRTTGSGWALRVRFEVTLEGPCVRCLEPAVPAFAVDAREVEQPGGGEDTDSPYVQGDELDLEAWARDALALALPAQIVCREDCLGLCAACGADLNAAGPEHRHAEHVDPRWSALDALRTQFG